MESFEPKKLALIRIWQMLFEKLEDEKGYLAPDLHNIFDDWYNNKLKTAVYPQYKDVVTVNREVMIGSIEMNPIAEFVKENRKAAGLTQEQFALRSGLGLRFVRELEQGKETVRMDKVNIALAMFNAQAVAGKKEDK